jgi:hypothetical protein
MSNPILYMRVSANRGSQLRRIGATDHCVVCGMPALPGVAAFAHIHMRDLTLSPAGDPSRVDIVMQQQKSPWPGTPSPCLQEDARCGRRSSGPEAEHLDVWQFGFCLKCWREKI